MKPKSTRFRLTRFAFTTDAGTTVYRYFITDDMLPASVVNEWLEANSFRSAGTGREYGKKLVVFLNYLDDHEQEYAHVTNEQVKSFMRCLTFGDQADGVIHSLENIPTYATLSQYETVITSFYRWLDDNYTTNIRFQNSTNYHRARKSFLYGQIYQSDSKRIAGIHLPSLKGRREYVKWYTDEEIERMANSFRSLRDKAIFQITLEGFRIDEVLSIRLADYAPTVHCIQPSRSKGKRDAQYGQKNHLRTIVLPTATCELLDEYLRTERMMAENQSRRLSEYLFINLNRGKYQGQPLSYSSYYKIFKSCGMRAGLDPTRLRTHSGRSTKVMRMLEAGASDTDILYQTGWRSIDSIQPYRDDNNPIMAYRIWQKLHPEGGGDND